jgi:phosphohistidine phosphatase
MEEATLRTVFLVRHAKSSWKDTTLDDKDRPLKKRGIKDLALLKPVLVKHRHKPEHIFSSDAKRAVETAKAMAGFYGLKKKNITFSEELYGLSCDGILDFIRSRGDELHSIMLVGHNPEMAETAVLLGEEPSEAAMPTSAVACFTFDLDHWDQLEESAGHMEFYEYPKKYK